MAIMLPSLREERAGTYSPFLPIDLRSGVVLQVPILAHDVKRGTITYEEPGTQERFTVPVTGGRCKLQWKPDWAMRWVALGVDYEMAGKDLIDSVKLSGEICRALDGLPPEGFNYELFLDENGQKISKSKGNGLTIDEWLRYASPESLSCFMYREPKAAKRLHFDVIPRTVDEYQQFLDGYQRQDGRQRLSNPVWHIHQGNPPKIEMPVTFSMLLTLVSSSNAENAETLWGFIGRYRPGVTAQTHPKLNAMVEIAEIVDGIFDHGIELGMRLRRDARPVTADEAPQGLGVFRVRRRHQREQHRERNRHLDLRRIALVDVPDRI